MSNAVVFIDSRVRNFERIISDLPDDARYVILSPQEDGLEQIFPLYVIPSHMIQSALSHTVIRVLLRLVLPY